MRNIFLSIIVAIIAVTNTSVYAKNYKGAEISLKKQYLYGKFETRVYFSKVSGTVQAFWFWNGGINPKVARNEVDIEVFGKDNCTTFGTNVIWEPCSSCTSSKMEPNNYLQNSSMADGWHILTIEWKPNSIKWFIDGRLIRETKGGTASNIKSACSVVYNLWASAATDWVGNCDTNALPAYIYADYLKIYLYNGSTGTFNASPDFIDNFNTVNTSIWQISHRTFDNNRVDFIPQNVGSVNGKLVLSLTTATNIGLPSTTPNDPLQANQKAMVSSILPLSGGYPTSNINTALKGLSYQPETTGDDIPMDNDIEQIKLDVVTSLEDNNNDQLSVMPNPSNGVFIIKSKNSDMIKYMEVVNIVGKKIFSKIGESSDELIDLTNQPVGIYLLKIETQERIYVVKIRKQ